MTQEALNGLALDLQGPRDNAFTLQQPPSLTEYNAHPPLCEKRTTKEHWLQSNYLGGAPFPGLQEARVGELLAGRALKIYLLHRMHASGLKTLIPLQRVTEHFPKDSQDLLSHKKHPYYISMLKGSSAYYSRREQRENEKKKKKKAE